MWQAVPHSRMYDSQQINFGRFRLIQTLRFQLLAIFAGAAVCALSCLAEAQRFDVAAGVSGIDAPGAHVADDINHQPQSLTGGAYMTISGDYLFFHKDIGVSGEFVRRISEGFDVVNNFPDRPMFWDANAIWTRKFYKHFTAELQGGAGEEIARFYTSSCSGCYADRNHFLLDGGAGIKVYPLNKFIIRHIFIRPEGRVYWVRNNAEFSSSHAIRYGVSIGYTF